jgi:uncharacterized repeat protein (TIGR04052 family)
MDDEGDEMRVKSFALGAAIVAIPIWTSQAASPAKQPVVISFAMFASGQTVDCDHDLKGLGTNKGGAKLHDARFYISAPALIDSGGAEVPIELEKNDWQHANVALLNFAGKSGACKGMSSLNDRIAGTAPPGDYRGFSFVVGVPATAKGDDGKDVSLNHSNFATAPAPLDIQAMSWNWQAGRKFMKIEVDPDGGVTRPPFLPAPGKEPPAPSNAASEKTNADGTITVTTWMLHLGSTGCKGDAITGGIVSCSGANRIPVKFATFNPAKQRVVLDLGTLFSGVDLNHDAGASTGCMSGAADPECGPIFEKLGLNLQDTAPGANDAGKPSARGSEIFHVESKE